VTLWEMSIERASTARYRLVVRGELGDKFGFLFAGMWLSRENGTTVLTGPVADQAQLVGIIDRMQGLGLELISVSLLAEAAGSHPEQA
jgi:hypothetical protein